jgi:hypothetical protein
MARFEIISPAGHDVIEFDRDAGPDHPKVKEAMNVFAELVQNQKMLAVTKNPGDADYRVARNFGDVQEQTTFKRQIQGG